MKIEKALQGQRRRLDMGERTINENKHTNLVCSILKQNHREKPSMIDMTSP